MKKYNDIIIGGVVIAIIAIGMVLVIGFGAKGANQIGSLIGTVSDQDWVEGNPNGRVTFVEYSDFQCPACAAYYPLVKRLVQDFGNDIRFVYRYFPLRAIHANADLASRAAEVAVKQGKFWEMHDKIFDNQRMWADSKDAETLFTNYAVSLGLDMYKFKADLVSPEVAQRVESDYESGIKSGVNYTPSFFLNGRKIQNPQSYDEFRAIVAQALASEL